jgi:hypothetical protein
MTTIAQKRRFTNKPRGYFVVLVLVFASVFFTLISALAGYIFVEKRAQLAKENREKALYIAEAGLDYYRWFLAHYPEDLQNGTGEPGPYVHTVNDPEGGVMGTFSLDIAGEELCGALSSVEIRSTGWTAALPAYTRTVSATYVRPSIAEFSHIVDENVWAGSDRIISGPYHSNQGVRMDGTHNAPVTSGVEEWTCTSSFGCSGNETVPGVFGSGGPQELWDYPIPQVDFNGITLDLDALEDYARDEGGLYFGRARGGINDRGYHAVFNADGTLTVYRVYDTTRVYSYTIEDSWEYEYTVIDDKVFVGTYDIPDTCPVVFFKDRVWLEGTVSGKVVVVAADVQSSQSDPDIILNNNITYANGSDVDGMVAIAERDVLVGLIVPNSMSINGIFVAQEGRFGRNHYSTFYLSNALDQYVLRDTLNTRGTIVSKGRVGTKWSCEGDYCSGFSQRNDSYDAQLANDPPPFVPTISDDYTFRNWQEVN